MAQSSAALREPTMDEILTSIREIIEESTALANENTPIALSAAECQTKSASIMADTANGNDSPESEQAAVSVEDAMNALAQRIGLKGAADSGVVADENGLAYSQPVEDASAACEGSDDKIHDENTMKEGVTNHDAAAPIETSDHSGSIQRPGFSDAVGLVADDILRPYISAWMDRNLPTLIERLLREEMVKALKAGL